VAYELDQLSDHEIAISAAKSIMARVSFPLCEDDFQDMVQEGYIAIVSCKQKDRPAEYYFKVAKYAASHWYLFWRYGAIRSKLRNARTNKIHEINLVPFEVLEEYSTGNNDFIEPECKLNLDNVKKLLYRSHTRHGDRIEKAIATDVRIIELLCCGYSNDAIAIELAITYQSVRGRREQIMRFIKNYAKSEIAP
jgi:hypothetical protein